jgi:ABC-2 type transport system ATP-binding protein
METMIRLKNVSKIFGTEISNNNISLEIFKGTSNYVIGQNGAGKTTLFKQIVGLTKPTSGDVMINNYDPFKEPEKALIGVHYLPGEISLPEKLKGIDFLMNLKNLRGHNNKMEIINLAKVFNLDLNKKIKTLSKGNKQKVALISVLMDEPKLLILDEPTTGLDVINQKKLEEALSNLLSQGCTLLISSHISNDVRYYSDCVISLENGNVTDYEIKNTAIKNSLLSYKKAEESNFKKDLLHDSIENSSKDQNTLQDKTHEKRSTYIFKFKNKIDDELIFFNFADTKIIDSYTIQCTVKKELFMELFKKIKQFSVIEVVEK